VPDSLGAGLAVVGFPAPLLGPVSESDDDEHAADKHEHTSSAGNELLTVLLLGTLADESPPGGDMGLSV
jgi:hypothetical protein